MGNVIDIRNRLKSLNEPAVSVGESAATVVDIAQLRDQIIQEDRRQVKRTILTEFVSLHAVVPSRGVMRVYLYDVNQNGLAFDLEVDKGHYNVGDDVELRMYLNHQTYFKIDTRVLHISIAKDTGFVRHGCEFIRESVNSEALNYFTNFLESVTASLRKDNGDTLVTKINS